MSCSEGYGLLIGNTRVSRHPMSRMVCETARGVGIHSIINLDRYTVTHQILEDINRLDVKESLKNASSQSGFELTPIQLETVMNTVWRARSRSIIRYKVCRENRPDINVSKTFDCPMTDIGSPVFIDLPPGMGKTIVSSISSLLISTERRGEIHHDRINSTSRGIVEIVEKKPGGGRVSMIFCPKHVHHQWMFAAKKAAEIVSVMYPSKKILVESNKTASSIESVDFDAALVVCDSSAFGLTKALEGDVIYGTLCFDECTENCDVKNNAVFSSSPDDLTYGRMILVSADFSKMADYNSKLGSCRQGALIRRVFGEGSTSDMAHAINNPNNSLRFYGYSNAATARAASTVACLTMNSVFPKDQRDIVVNTSAGLLSDVTLYTFGINYRRSIFERMGSSAAFDLNPTNGNDRFMEAVGVDITGCTSIEEILERVEANRVTVHNRVNRRAVRALEVLRDVVSEDCVICMEKMDQASIIQPCFHVVCNSCLPRLGASGRCPMCRDVIVGAVTSNVVCKRSVGEAFGESGHSNSEYPDNEKSEEDSYLPLGEGFAKAIETLIPTNDGSLVMKDTMGHVLRALSIAHDRSGGGTFRGIVICSQVDLNTTGFTSDGYEIIRYRAKGTTRSPVTRKKLVKQINDFQKEDGKKKLMLVHDETSGSGYLRGSRSGRDDNITGLDFPRLEAVVSIGSENRSQRVGRLCRMSRLFMDRDKRDAVYVELSGV